MKLIYDGDCDSCTKSANFAKKRLANKKVLVVPWQTIDDLSKYGLTEKEVNERVYWVNDDNSTLGSSKAILSAAIQMKKPWPYIAKYLSLPGISFLSEMAYKVISKNRHRLPGGTKNCEIEKP